MDVSNLGISSGLEVGQLLAETGQRLARILRGQGAKKEVRASYWLAWHVWLAGLDHPGEVAKPRIAATD